MPVPLLLLAVAAPTLAAIRRLPPEAAGEAALAGLPHAPIVAVRSVSPGLTPPGLTELEMIERARPLAGGGCLRQRWVVTFSGPALQAANLRRLDGARPRREIAAQDNRRCPTGVYAEVGPGLSPPMAVAELARAAAWQAGREPPAYRCSDETSSNLCATPTMLRNGLAPLRPWMVAREGEDVLIWLGHRAGVVTELRYSRADPGVVHVTRRIPAPF